MAFIDFTNEQNNKSSKCQLYSQCTPRQSTTEVKLDIAYNSHEHLEEMGKRKYRFL